jgi:hypothetical protein
MPLMIPDRPTRNPFQDAGDALLQAGQQSNLLADMVDRRLQRRREMEIQDAEEKRKEWEQKQKEDEVAKSDKARMAIDELVNKGVKVPGSQTEIPATVEDVPGPWAPARLPPSAPYDVPQYGLPTMPIEQPAQTVSTPDTYRPATPSDLNASLFANEQLSGKEYSASLDPYRNDPMARAYAATMGQNKAKESPNRDAALAAVRQLIFARKKDKKSISKSDLDMAALGADPTGQISSDPAYQALVKNYSTDEAVNNSNFTRTSVASDPAQVAMLAKDLASGALTMQQMRALTGVGSKGNAVRLAVYQAAKSQNPDFNPAEFEKSFKAYESTSNQKALAQINAVKPNIDQIIDLSNQVKRTGMPAVNSLIASGRYAVGNTKVTSLEEMRHALSDELGSALSGAGTFSDAKLQLAKELLDTDISADNFASNMQLLKHMLDTREGAIKAPMGIYGDGSHIGGAGSSGKQKWVRDPATGQLRPQ